MAQRKSPAAKKQKGGDGALPDQIFAQASPHSVGGVSLFESMTPVTSDSVPGFFSEDRTIQLAAMRLQEAGFQVLQVSATTINIAGPAATYEAAFNTKLVTDERSVIKAFGEETTATFVDTTDTALPGLISTEGTALGEVLEGVAIETPKYYMAENAFAPTKAYWHLDVPGGVSLGVNADLAHRGATTGKGVKVVMVDSGWYRHSYFTRRGYRGSPPVLGPGAANPLADESGHGTAESANIFAAAPDVDFTMVKMNFANSTGSFNAAVALAPQIISCSWGSSIENGPLGAADQALAAAIATAVASGIVVVFSAGNGHFGFPGQHPDVISAGGVFMTADGAMRASDYASGFPSKVYPGRNTPDVSGLVGMKPAAAYIMLPLQSNDAIDQGASGGTHPAKDETTATDGWAAISGTSAAAPQVAGVCALMKQACLKLSPVEIRSLLMKSARDVTVGTNNNGHTAGVGYDNATGAGLVDAHKAVLLTKLNCQRTQPIRIANPIQGPIQPIQGPIQPIQGPIQPIQGPIRPIDPVVLPGPQQEAMEAQAPAESSLSGEDIEAIERLILDDGL